MTVSRSVQQPVLIVGVAVGVFLLSVTTVSANDRTPSSPAIYYEMNGGDSVGDALNPSAVISPITLGADFTLPSSCDIWENREQLGDPQGTRGQLFDCGSYSRSSDRGVATVDREAGAFDILFSSRSRHWPAGSVGHADDLCLAARVPE